MNNKETTCTIKGAEAFDRAATAARENVKLGGGFIEAVVGGWAAGYAGRKASDPVIEECMSKPLPTPAADAAIIARLPKRP